MFFCVEVSSSNHLRFRVSLDSTQCLSTSEDEDEDEDEEEEEYKEEDDYKEEDEDKACFFPSFSSLLLKNLSAS